ncbi:MAG TPA: hypothetical protein VFF70_05120 [Anaerolineae bacterium]|nr:hypothetical protein [Anaerolineae bacterium]
MISALRDVSLILLIFPVMLCLLIPIGILFGSVWLTGKANKNLRPKVQSAHRSMREVERKVDRVGQRIVRPLVALEMRWVRIQVFLRGLRLERKQP